MLPAGTQLNNGGFSIGRMLGRGGFGITYLGADLRLKRAVAIKEFFPAGSARTARSVVFSGGMSRQDYALAVDKFMQEAQMLARFQHRSIVNVYEVFPENDTAYMVMEYLQGENLLGHMESRGSPLPEPELVAVSSEIAEALAEVHEAGVLHRDIKPENIMLVGPENARRPVLIDFGAAREFASGMVNRHSIVLTPGYAPLEQYGEQARRGPFTDVYALAATLYHVATGVQPPAATERALGVTLRPPRELAPALSVTFDAALMHGLEMKVDARPQTALQFQAEMTTGVRPPTTRPAPRMPGSDASPDTLSAPQSRIEHVRQIAGVLGQMRAVQTDRQVCPVCCNATMFDTTVGVTDIRCPVCQVARLRSRFPASAKLRCPSCARAELEPMHVSSPGVMMTCPHCQQGSVVGYIGAGLLIPDFRAECDTCGANFDFHSTTDSFTLEDLPSSGGQLDERWIGETRTREEWGAMGGGEIDAYLCRVCNSAFQVCAANALEWVARNGNESDVPREHRRQCRSLSQWRKIAERLPLDSGSVVCSSCDAQFDEPAVGQLTLLEAARDPHQILAAHRNKTYSAATWLMLGAGQRPPDGRGLACPECAAYLQAVRGEQYRLATFDTANDPHGHGQRYARRELSRTDWQRIAAGGLPQEEYTHLRDEALGELWAAMVAGEVSTSVARQSYPEPLAAGERVVVTFRAVRLRTRMAVFEEQDEGQIWLSTRQLVFRGERGNVIITLANVGSCSTQAGDPALVGIFGKDDTEQLRFRWVNEPLEMVINGLALQLPWNVQAFAELFESLRLRAAANVPA